MPLPIAAEIQWRPALESQARDLRHLLAVGPAAVLFAKPPQLAASFAVAGFRFSGRQCFRPGRSLPSEDQDIHQLYLWAIGSRPNTTANVLCSRWSFPAPS